MDDWRIEQIYNELATMNDKLQVANELAYHQLKATPNRGFSATDTDKTIMNDLNARIYNA